MWDFVNEYDYTTSVKWAISCAMCYKIGTCIHLAKQMTLIVVFLLLLCGLGNKFHINYHIPVYVKWTIISMSWSLENRFESLK